MDDVGPDPEGASGPSLRPDRSHDAEDPTDIGDRAKASRDASARASGPLAGRHAHEVDVGPDRFLGRQALGGPGDDRDPVATPRQVRGEPPGPRIELAARGQDETDRLADGSAGTGYAAGCGRARAR
jgi:hypothetical protein